MVEINNMACLIDIWIFFLTNITCLQMIHKKEHKFGFFAVEWQSWNVIFHINMKTLKLNHNLCLITIKHNVKLYLIR